MGGDRQLREVRGRARNSIADGVVGGRQPGDDSSGRTRARRSTRPNADCNLVDIADGDPADVRLVQRERERLLHRARRRRARASRASRSRFRRPDSPNVLAYSVGVSRQLGNRAVVRADYSYRDFRDFYSQRIDTTTGRVVDQLGNPQTWPVVENTNDLKRRYQGLTLSTTIA